MSSSLAKFLSTFGLLLACVPKILLFLHWSSFIRQLGSLEVLWKSEGLDPAEDISKRIPINFLPIENEYIFWSFFLLVWQNKHLLDLSLSKRLGEVLGEHPLLNASLPFWNVGKVWSCSVIWDFLQVNDLPPICLRRINCSEIPQVLISPVELHLSSKLPLFLNLFGRKEFWNSAQRTKYSNLELIFPNFLNEILALLPAEPVSLWNGKVSWPKDVLLTYLHPEFVECWGKVILFFLPFCLRVCFIVLTKSACGARLPPRL